MAGLWKNTIGAVFLLLSGSLFSALAGAEPRFENRAEALGIDHVYDGGWSHFVGGGTAVFDCNRDGFPDIFLSGGANADSLLINETKTSGDPLNFKKDILETGGAGTIGAYPLDLDSDGILDLFVLKVGQNKILKGLGNCLFEDRAADFGYQDAQMWSTAFSATWEGHNALPTLAVGNYVDQDHPDAPFGTCESNYLYRPVGQKYGTPTTLNPGFCALSMLFSDWSRRGFRDLRVSNDRHYYVKGGAEQLWQMSATPVLYGEDQGWRAYSIWGMGIASRDITGDGIPEVYLTSMGDQKLQSLQTAEAPEFINAPFKRGITAHRPYVGGDGRPSTGWHAAFADVNNDGLDDLFVAKGNVDQMPDAALADPNNLLIQLENGAFFEVGADAGIASLARGRGAAVVDLNLDGLLDIVVVNRRAPAEIYENITAETGGYLQLDIRQSNLNTRAVGAWIEVAAGDKIWHREITVGGGHASGQSGFHHFGLGAAKDVKIRIRWPDGAMSSWQRAGIDHHLLLMRSGDEFQLKPLTSKSTE